uniref:Phlebovirus_G2 domain-containing protein n=1 Tax=Heterorhabditis bacteriophora TaxID=37862 RepID=A0A1I7WI25_HETBA
MLPFYPNQRPILIRIRRFSKESQSIHSLTCPSREFCDGAIISLCIYIYGIVSATLLIAFTIRRVHCYIQSRRDPKSKVSTNRIEVDRITNDQENTQEVKIDIIETAHNIANQGEVEINRDSRDNPFNIRDVSFTKYVGKGSLAIMLLTITVQTAVSCQEGYVRRSTNVICQEDQPQGTENCYMEYNEELFFNSIHKSFCLRVKHQNTSIGFIEIMIKPLKQTCQKVYSSKRCPLAGSCHSNTCAIIRINQRIPELNNANSYPGNVRCSESCAGWFCGCALPGDACMFYKVVSDTKIKVPSITTQNDSLMNLIFAKTSEFTVIVPNTFTTAVRCVTEDQARNRFVSYSTDEVCLCSNNSEDVECVCKTTFLATLHSQYETTIPITTHIMVRI